MSKKTLITLGIPALIVVLLIGSILWKSLQPPAAMPAPPPAVVSSTAVTEEQREPTISAVGSMVAVNGIEVSTEVEGIVSEIVFQSGQTVAAGDTLIKLDVDVDVAALDALRAERKLASIQFSRAKDLLKKKVTSKSEFDEAQARFEAASARVKQQEAIISRKIIRAPFAGLTGIRKVDLGQYIEAGDSIVSLQVLDPIYVDYTLPERYTTQIKTGQTVRLKLDALPDKSYTGKVSAINAGIDTGTRTLKVRAELSNDDGLLKPGMFTRVNTITGDAQTALTLPRTAVSVNTYGDFVFVINESDDGKLKVKRTPVKLGESLDGRVIVTNLAKDTRVVRTGLVKLRDGIEITIDNQIQLDDANISGE